MASKAKMASKVKMASKAKKDDHAWEREFAPRVTRGRLITTLVVFGLWLVFLAAVSAHRWFGELQ